MESGDWKSFLQAATEGDIEKVRYYLSAGADPNYLHPEIMTNALIEASRMRNMEIVNLLLSAGGDPKIKSQMGESPIGLAKNTKDQELLRLLKKKH